MGPIIIIITNPLYRHFLFQIHFSTFMASWLLFIVIVDSHQMTALKVLISRSHFSSSTVKSTSVFTHSLKHALIACNADPSCSCVCDEGTGKNFTLTDLYVVPGVPDDTPGDKIECYTSKRRMLYPGPGALLTGSLTYSPTKPIDVLRDGIYDRDIANCFHSTHVVHTYILVELPKVSAISAVTVRSQPKGYMANKMLSLETRVGNTSSNGDFSGNAFLGSYSAGPPSHDEDIVFKGMIPIWGKFISIQDATVHLPSYLHVCVVEVI